ncbi:MAG: integration host factor subunit alpha [Desulfobacteraceae bacterium]|jgi:integration host factor subunit alpha|nr:integration host factor subunit alpha [Desulfobacteraceae bacterium]HKJ32279.1 integration host factor subunit alpha [Balneolales bacterium]
MALTKAEIVDSISDQIGFPKNHSFEIIEILLEIMKKTLESGDDVMISNFGKFCVKEKRERRGRNPSTGQEMILKPRKVVTFKCSGTLREKINR